MKRISKISKINKIENNLRKQEEPKTKTKSEKELDFDSMLKEEKRKLEGKNKKNTLDSYKIEIQKAMITQKKIPQIEEEQENEKY